MVKSKVVKKANYTPDPRGLNANELCLSTPASPAFIFLLYAGHFNMDL